ncbi:twin-arginine translocation signal domain-containing protein [Bradyrhizobium sp.]|uniref:twin-arginine translocation signal domain-containing protein n=1 Tax=Bradyrhizobium sp. TaxID=376 RepID=UPI003C78CD17
MERRHFLKLAFGLAAGAATLAASAQAAPLSPHPLHEDGRTPAGPDAQPAVTNAREVEHLKPEEVRWGHHGHGHGHHWGWRRGRHRGWHRRHHRHWHHRRYW